MTQNVVMYTVEVNTENPDSLLMPYLTANVHFVTRKESNVLLVPNAALRWFPTSLSQISPEFRTPAAGDPPAGAKSTGQGKDSGAHSGTIWLADGNFVKPLEVTLGTSDGTSTAINADQLREGQKVVTGELTGNGQSATKNPFLPQVIRR
jgi:HlyD family secretion protein